MRIENLYPVFRYIASKQLGHLLKKDASNWKRQWSEFFLNDLINFQYEDIIAVDFREKQKARGIDKGLKASFQRLDYMLSWVFLGAMPEDYFSMVFDKKGLRFTLLMCQSAGLIAFLLKAIMSLVKGCVF